MLSDSNSILPALSPAKSATRNSLLRLWATPKYCASSILHAILYPLPNIFPACFHFPSVGRGTETPLSATDTNELRTALKSSPLFELNAPGTFSQTANRGYLFADTRRISLIILIASKNKLLLSPSCIPACLPAIERS